MLRVTSHVRAMISLLSWWPLTCTKLNLNPPSDKSWQVPESGYGLEGVLETVVYEQKAGINACQFATKRAVVIVHARGKTFPNNPVG